MELTIVDWNDDHVVMIDQRKLPTEETYVQLRTMQEVADAISNMTVRGAPAIGVAAAMGFALGAQEAKTTNWKAFQDHLAQVSQILFQTRPTAVNLKWALDHMTAFTAKLEGKEISQVQKMLIDEAVAVKNRDIETNRLIGKHGQELLADGDKVLTHCNAGALATAGFGTALGVIYAAVEAGKAISVIADETRPVLQGARLSAWELQKNNVPVTVIADNMAASFMRAGRIHKIVVGADRIAANGDVANKIGTYSVAINAKHHGIPFFVAAPFSTIDPKTVNGEGIPIEQRSPREITHVGETQLVPDGVMIENPAFDVTPAELVSGIITEKGVFHYPYHF